MSGMVTIPVSMYQTVVTNLNLQGDNSIPITMSAITGTNQLEAGNDENDDVKAVLNGQNSIRITTATNEGNS